ncbi:MAG TPA: ABC transporter permease [Planctomycetota bacterium]|nr:ABC transporter permease [Planctomycetota bacterium]
MIAVMMALQALAANKLRAALTILGTVIGVGCVVALWHIGDSGRSYMSNSLASIGQNLIFISTRYSAGEDEDQRRFKFRPLTLSDAEAIKFGCPSVKDVSPMLFGSGQAVNGKRFRRTQIRGCYASYMQIMNYEFSAGVSFSDADVKSGNRVAVLGHVVAQELFGAIDPIKQVIRINQVPFTVVGILKPKGSFFGDNQDDRILVPFTSAAVHLGFGRNVHMMFASALERGLIPQAKNEIRLAIRKSQKLSSDRKDGIELNDLGEVAASVDKVLIGITMLLGAIGATSLLVGGIGIMNIMLVSVTERTKEIGLRVALGATDFNVLMQFLIEAMVLSGLGGVIGTIGGIGMAAATTAVLTMVTGQVWPMELSVPALVTAMIFALAVGVFFGFYPAWRASRLDPITALRHE